MTKTKFGAYIDADDTIWDVYVEYPNKSKQKYHKKISRKKIAGKYVEPDIASSCYPPYHRIDANTLKGTSVYDTDCFIVLKEDVPKLLKKLKDEEFRVVLVSANNPKPVKKALKKFGIHKYFDKVYVSWMMDKEDLVLKDVAKNKVNEYFFIDDSYPCVEGSITYRDIHDFKEDLFSGEFTRGEICIGKIGVRVHFDLHDDKDMIIDEIMGRLDELNDEISIFCENSHQLSEKIDKIKDWVVILEDSIYR